MRGLEPEVEKTAEMNKTTAILSLIVLLGLIGAVVHTVWWREEPAGNDAAESGTGRAGLAPSGEPGNVAGPGLENAEESLDPPEAVDFFRAKLEELRGMKGESWVAGVRELSELATRLGRRRDYGSVVSSAVMTGELSDMAMARMMAGEISPDEAIRGLEDLAFIPPSDSQLIDFISQSYPNGEEERRRNPPESVLEFASKFEPEIIFPREEEWGPEKTPIGIIDGPNITFSLFVISVGKMKLETARITAIYLQMGGAPSLRNEELAADLAMRVGKEIAELPVPLFGEEKPDAGGIVFLIDNAISTYPMVRDSFRKEE